MDNSQPYLTERNRMFARKFYLAMYGEEAKEDIRIGDEIDKARQEIKEIKQKAEEAKQKAEEAKQKAMKEKEKTILNLFTTIQLSVEQISESMELPFSEVEQILKKNKLI